MEYSLRDFSLKSNDISKFSMEDIISFKMQNDPKNDKKVLPVANPMFEFSEYEDKFLACALYKFGYGAWELIRNDIRNCDLFRFNWIAKSRTAVEIGKRCEILVTKFKKEVAYEREL